MSTHIQGTVWLGTALSAIEDVLTIQGGPEGVGFYSLNPDDFRGNVVVHDGQWQSEVDWDPCCIRAIITRNGSSEEQIEKGQLHFKDKEQLQLIGPDVDGKHAEISIVRGTYTLREGNHASHERLYT